MEHASLPAFSARLLTLLFRRMAQKLQMLSVAISPPHSRPWALASFINALHIL